MSARLTPRICSKAAKTIEKFPQVAAKDIWAGAFGGMPLPATGIFAALDMKTNRLVWQQRWKDTCYSGSVTTAGGLVFVGRNDGRLTALNSSNGQRLWEFQTGAGVNAPASVFEYEGDAIRRGLFRRQSVRRRAARGQPLPFLSQRHADLGLVEPVADPGCTRRASLKRREHRRRRKLHVQSNTVSVTDRLGRAA